MLLLLVIIILFSSFILIVKSENYNYKQRHTYQYFKSNLISLADSMNEESIVFLGSSSIQRLNTERISDEAINLGINGEKLQQLIDRVKTYKKISTVKVVVFMAGFNDMCKGSNVAFKKFKELLQNIPSTALVIVGLQPSVSTSLCDELRNEITNYNDKLLEFCIQHVACTYVDTTKKLKILANKESYSLKRYFEEDGIHLNKKGYEFLEAEIAKSINNLTGVPINN